MVTLRGINDKMSLCYEFQKWTIISLALVAISLSIGLVLMQYAHGQKNMTQQQREALVNYCYQHADIDQIHYKI